MNQVGTSGGAYSVLLPGGGRYGPVDAGTLLAWAREGRVPAGALIDRGDGGPPTPAASTPELRGMFAAPPTVGGPLMAPAPAADGGMSSLIPYRNGAALAGYYVGVFSLIPVIGVVLAVVAIVLGGVGLSYAGRHPEAKGKVHAVVAIVLGLLVLVGHAVVGIMFFG